MNKPSMIIMLSLVVISCKEETTEDIVVIGGGLMGSATAWQLSANGESVLLLEQQDSVYSFGSSFGEARISRSLGPKNDIFSYLQQTSVSETKKLIDYLNASSGGETHRMEAMYTTSPVTYIYDQSQQETVQRLLDGQTDQYEYAANPKAASELFGMTIPDSAMVIREYKAFSGTLNPKILISKLHRGVKTSGSKIVYNTKVTGIRRKHAHYEINTIDRNTGQKRVIRAKKIAVAAGPYTGTVLKDIAPYFSRLIVPRRLFLAFFKIDNNAFENYTDVQRQRFRDFFPVANFNPALFYAMIEKYDEDGSPILKVGGHLLRTGISALDSVWERDLSREETAWSKNSLQYYLQMLNMSIDSINIKFYKGYSCVYSLTATEVPYVTNIVNDKGEKDPDFIVVGGMSGIGAKGSLAYGRIAADLLLNRKDTTAMYRKTKAALGFERLLRDIEQIDE